MRIRVFTSWTICGLQLTLALFAVCVLQGCGQKSSGTNDGGNSAMTAGDDLTAAELLTRMATAYRQAKTYQDAATVTLRFEQNGQQVNETFDFNVAFVRPNKLHVDCYGLELRNDGRTVRGWIRGNEDFAGQVLEIDAPADLNLFNMIVDYSMQQVLEQGVAQTPPPLVLLLAENALDLITQKSKTPLLLPVKNYEDQPCHRVRIDSEYGSLVLWIDQGSYVLRRIDFPIASFKRELEQTYGGPVSDLALFADFTGAKFNEAVPEAAFQMEIPKGAKLVRRLWGPAPSPPSELLGKAVPAFEFVNVDGEKITPDTLKGKITVLDFWFTQCSPCQQGFPLLNKVYERYKNRDDVGFITVNADSNAVSDQTVRETHKAWGSTLPLARDLNEHIKNAWQVSAMPAMFVIGSDGTVQHHEMGVNAELEKELPETIELLLQGKSTVERAKKNYETRLAEFERVQQTPPEIPSPDGQSVEIPRTTIAPRSEPIHHRLEKMWTAADLKQPGNILIIEPDSSGSGTPKIIAFDGWNTVVELKPDGAVAARHELELPQDAVVAALRTAVDGQGKRYYVAFLSAQPQLHVFDESWKHLLSFPPREDKHDGIGDVQLTDLNGDGTLELGVGFWGDVGVQCASLDGKRLWTNRTLQFVLRMASTAPESGAAKLLAANSRGGLLPLDQDGKESTEIQIAGRPLQSVHSADLNGDGKLEYTGLSIRSLGANTVVGFNLEGRELWHYDLPLGVAEKPIETVSASRLLGDQSQWLTTAADGSVHILDAEGKLVDRFNYGATLCGIAGTRFASDSVLLISSDQGLTAWKLVPLDEKLTRNPTATPD
jgi:thiol-disulfide isomerase/thioredoxin